MPSMREHERTRVNMAFDIDYFSVTNPHSTPIITDNFTKYVYIGDMFRGDEVKGVRLDLLEGKYSCSILGNSQESCMGRRIHLCRLEKRSVCMNGSM